MTYNLGNYKYYKFKLYKKIFWFIYKCIDKGPYSYLVGVRKVNKLCGINEEVDINKFTKIAYTPDKSRYIINFKDNFQDSYFLNDPLPATVKSCKNNIISIVWDNGYRCKLHTKYFNFFNI